MQRSLTGAAILAVLAAVAFGQAAGGNKSAKSDPSRAAAAFERLKQLTGDWVVAGDSQGNVVSSWRSTAAGSVMMETLFPGQEEEMITMYHMDGDRLIATHYCSARNQPRLRLLPDEGVDVLKLEFFDATNMKPADSHMHHVELAFKGPDQYVATWVGYKDGKPEKGHEARFDLVRKKK